MQVPSNIIDTLRDLHEKVDGGLPSKFADLVNTQTCETPQEIAAARAYISEKMNELREQIRASQREADKRRREADKAKDERRTPKTSRESAGSGQGDGSGDGEDHLQIALETFERDGTITGPFEYAEGSTSREAGLI